MTLNSNQEPLFNERLGIVREVGNNAIWSLSSCKPGKSTMSLHRKKEYNNHIDLMRPITK